jgi:hypothetical protein
MPFPEIMKTFDYSNKLIAEALNYDKDEMAKLHESLIHKLTDEQAHVYKQIMDSVLTGMGGFFSYTFTEAPEKPFCGILCLQRLDLKV